MADANRRAVTISRPQEELSTAWEEFLRRQNWREYLVSSQIETRPGGGGTVLRLLVGSKAKTDDVELALRQFKALQETGEIPSTEGQPAGDRGVIERIKESLTSRNQIDGEGGEDSGGDKSATRAKGRASKETLDAY